MIEDDIYRSSTQYRRWSFTADQLATQRKEANEYAAAKVCAAFQRVKTTNGTAKSWTGNDEAGGRADSQQDVDTLTVEEELKIVEWGCGKIQEMGTALRLPKSLIATAMQYLRRFYLTNSPMTYHPKAIMACALFIATKSSHFHLTPHHFTTEFNNLTEDDLKAPEFLVLQGLQFTLDVRHPFLGLDGGWIEMKEMIDEERILSGVHDGEKRGLSAIQTAKGLLRREAQMTDVYFLYTPAQIWMASVYCVDEELLRSYLDAKFEDILANLPTQGEAVEKMQTQFKTKILTTIQQCASTFKAWKSPEDDKKERKELARIGKKLAKCQDPEKADIVAVARAKRAEKREKEPGASGSERDENVKKRKKVAGSEDGDVFGGELRSVAG